METVTFELPDGDDLTGLTLSAYSDLLWQLEVVRRRAEAAMVAVTDACDRSGEYAGDGHRNVTAWGTATVNCSRSIATARSRSARMLRSIVLLAAAKTLEFHNFRIVTQRWTQLADADGAHDRHQRAHRHRDAQLTQTGETFRFETAHAVIEGEGLQHVFSTLL